MGIITMLLPKLLAIKGKATSATDVRKVDQTKSTPTVNPFASIVKVMSVKNIQWWSLT